MTTQEFINSIKKDPAYFLSIALANNPQAVADNIRAAGIITYSPDEQEAWEILVEQWNEGQFETVKELLSFDWQWGQTTNLDADISAAARQLLPQLKSTDANFDFNVDVGDILCAIFGNCQTQPNPNLNPNPGTNPNQQGSNTMLYWIVGIIGFFGFIILLVVLLNMNKAKKA